MKADQDLSRAIRTGGRYSVLPARAFADNRLQPGDIFVLGLLTVTEHARPLERKHGWFEISQSALAFLGCISRSTVNRAVRKLETSGYLETRPQQTCEGGKAAKLYRVIQDGELDLAFDRWAADLLGPDPLAAAVKNSGNLDVASAHIPCGADDNTSPSRDGAPAHMGCASAPHHHVHKAHIAETVMSPQCTSSKSADFPVVLESIPFSEEKDSESTLWNNVGCVSVSGPASPEPAQQVVDAFLHARNGCFPDKVGKGVSKRGKLEAQAAHYLDRGLCADRMISVLYSKMQISAERGMDAPAGLTRFRMDLDKALEERFGRMPPAPVQVQAPPAGSAKTENRARASHPKWEQISVRIADTVPPLAPWISMMRLAEINTGAAVIRMRTEAALDLARGHHGAVLSACRAVLGPAACASVIFEKEGAIQ